MSPEIVSVDLSPILKVSPSTIFLTNYFHLKNSLYDVNFVWINTPRKFLGDWTGIRSQLKTRILRLLSHYWHNFPRHAKIHTTYNILSPKYKWPPPPYSWTVPYVNSTVYGNSTMYMNSTVSPQVRTVGSDITCCARNAESSAPNNYRKIKNTKFKREQEKNNCIINNYLSTNLSKEISLSQNPNTPSTLTHTLQLLTLLKA